MRWSIKHKINLGFGSVLTCLVIIGGVSYQSTIKLIETERWVTHTHEVLQKLEDVIADITSAETAQKSYLITGQQLELKPYQAERQEIKQVIKQLRQLTVDNQKQQQQLNLLEPLISARFEELEQIIALRQHKGFEAALQVERTAQGKQIKDEIRAVVHSMQNEEKQLLRQRSKKAEVTAQYTTATIVSGSLIASVFVGLASWLINRDITKRQQAEAALRQTRNFLQTMIDHLPVAVFVKDGKKDNFGVYRLWNKTCETMFGFMSQQAIGNTDYDFFPKDQADFFNQKDREAFKSGSVEDIPQELIDSNSRGRRILHTLKVPLYDQDHEPEYLLCISEDITERKQGEEAQLQAQVAIAANEQLSQALEKEKELNELKSRFITTASHEFRTPLTTIFSSAELLQHYSHKWTEEKKLNHIYRIQAAVKHMTGLLNDVLLIGQAESGKLKLNLAPLDLAQFCRELVEEMQFNSDIHTIAFCTQQPRINAVMDEKLLRHIIINLLSNALKYSPKGSTVNFDLICEQEEVIFRIQDQGIGIPVADQAQLFNSFHRASNVGTISGTGLGLAIVKQAVDLHGGQITVASEVGVGTTFIVTLPLN